MVNVHLLWFVVVGSLSSAALTSVYTYDGLKCKLIDVNMSQCFSHCSALLSSAPRVTVTFMLHQLTAQVEDGRLACLPPNIHTD